MELGKPQPVPQFPHPPQQIWGSSLKLLPPLLQEERKGPEKPPAPEHTETTFCEPDPPPPQPLPPQVFHPNALSPAAWERGGAAS